ncbi:hypothetical protein [Streptomyces sp. NPDC006925]|uniref:hypothetical protein n=1 Tax=Streptomyces sp. NPDC006925 TaxID=3364768 RepID=UPI003683B563
MDSHLMITAHKFATTESAESSMRKQRDLGTGFDGSKMSELGKPGEFGDEAIIEVYEQDEKTLGGETYLSINITTITFRAGNLRVHLVYSRSRDADGEPGHVLHPPRSRAGRPQRGLVPERLTRCGEMALGKSQGCARCSPAACGPT